MNQPVHVTEPRTPMMAVAEVCWRDHAGASHPAPARIEDSSPSGVCIRIKTPIEVGSKLTIKWQREQFSGIARNCRSDGIAFLMGIQRDNAAGHLLASLPANGNGFEASGIASAELWWEDHGGTAHHTPAKMESRDASETCLRLTTPIPVGSTVRVKWQKELFAGLAKSCRWDGRAYLLSIEQKADREIHAQAGSAPSLRVGDPPSRFLAKVPSPPKQQAAAVKISATRSLGDTAASTTITPPAQSRDAFDRGSSIPTRNHDKKIPEADHPRPSELQTPASSDRHKRKIMESKSLIPKFWRHQQDETDAPENAASTEAPVNKLTTNAPEIPEPQGNLLSCEDIYHASGILSARSRYGINKIIEMLTSRHIRDLSKEVKRSSLLMALDAAGSTVDDVLQDAARRQHALSAYEAGQQKQFDEFEARSVRENAQIQAEMERVTAHYANRIKHNLDQVAQERAALCSWQAMKEQESQRITEAMALCGRQPIVEPTDEVLPAMSSPRVSATAV
jgi:hypothetical protein